MAMTTFSDIGFNHDFFGTFIGFWIVTELAICFPNSPLFYMLIPVLLDILLRGTNYTLNFMGCLSSCPNLLEQLKHKEKVSALVLGWQYAFCRSLHYMAHWRSKACMVQPYKSSTSTCRMAYLHRFFGRGFLLVFPYGKHNLVVSFSKT